MSSQPKRSPQSKRAALPRRFDYARQFRKDWDRLIASGRYDMNRLKHVMLMLIAAEPLPPERLDHPLSGDWAGFRECHIGGDFLLIYEFAADGAVIFVRAGTHADLFEH